MIQYELPDTGTSPVFHGTDPGDLAEFTRLVRGYYQQGRRPMPWRDLITPYRVVVSEVMLQQTRVSRVLEKYPAFIRQFPDFSVLSRASLADVIAAWQGLGYNRRARYLHAIAIRVMEEWGGELPESPALLASLPGIGRATAGSIAAFAFNLPVVFIETNIRRVYIHHFFPPDEPVDDSRILPLVQATLDQENPREWYYALMDYGTWLAARVENPNRRSRHYSKQPPFEGSDRQIRGRVLRLLVAEKEATAGHLVESCCEDRERGSRIVSMMIGEGLLCENKGKIRIADSG
jgi:A/G-specific adenine glycosylase